MFEERARRTARRPERCQGPSIRRQRPAREAPRLGPAPLTARGVASTAEVRAQVLRAPRPPGATAAARAHPEPFSLPIWEPRVWGQKGEGAPGAAAASGSRRPLGARREALGGVLSLHSPPAALSAGPQTPLQPPHKFSRLPSGPAPGPLPLSRPYGRPSPAGGVPRSRLLRRASARPAGRRLMCPASPSPSPPPSSLLLHLFRRRLRLSLRPRPKPLPPPPPAPAARSHGEAPAHCALRWGRGRPAAAWERGARRAALGWEGAPGARGRPRECSTFRGRVCALPSGPGRGTCRSDPPARNLDPGWAQTSPPGQVIPPACFSGQQPPPAGRASLRAGI